MDEEHSADDERSEFQPETPNTSEVSTDSDEHVMQDSIEPATEANEEQGGPVSSSSRRGLLTALGTVGLLGIAGTNTASAEVLSGVNNTAPEETQVVAGGQGNEATGDFAALLGGLENSALGDFSTIGGGESNSAEGTHATVSGGLNNQANGTRATVSGGELNEALNIYGTVGGGINNSVGGNQATIGGGASNNALNNGATVGGGANNQATGLSATVGGGAGNEASAENTTVGGGLENTVSGITATIGGGINNTASGLETFIGGGSTNEASGALSTVGGGTTNAATELGSFVGGGRFNTTSGIFATVPGGQSNTAAGDNSFAAGNSATAEHDGAVVFADSTSTPFESEGPNEFYSQMPIFAPLFVGQLAQASARAKKQNIDPVDPETVLDHVADLEVSTWEYTERDSGRHMGPMAGDFQEAFGLGDDDETITSIDADGVALAAIQGLAKRNAELEDRLTTLEEKVS